MVKNIAIDGPAGAGKSTIARKLARKLGFRYLDSGAMYRAVTWQALKQEIKLEDERKLVSLAEGMEIVFLSPAEDGISPLLVEGQDITKEIRQPIIDQNVSLVAKVKGVREAMVRQQREMASTGNIVVDGRDIGTRVLPEADLKLYITASLEERSKRRYQEQLFKNPLVNYQEIKNKIIRRDKIDCEREFSPLVKDQDAILIDTSNLPIEEVINKIMQLIKDGEHND